MGRVIAIASQKGGVGKTTTTINLGACLAEGGKKVLIVDVDPQGNASSGLGINGNDQRFGVYEALIGPMDLTQAIVPTPMEGLSIMTSGQRLSGAEVELVGMMARETRLRAVVGALREAFDFILIDCPPSLGLLTVNALTAADSVLIPLQCEYLALEGLTQLISAIRLVQDHLNSSLRIEGVLLTMFDVRLNLAQQVVDEARKFFSDRVYKTVIPRSVRLGEAPSFGKPIVQYDPHSSGAERYRDLALEVLGNASVGRAATTTATTAVAAEKAAAAASAMSPASAENEPSAAITEAAAAPVPIHVDADPSSTVISDVYVDQPEYRDQAEEVGQADSHRPGGSEECIERPSAEVSKH
jgi:chromosome partitioning protein